MNEPIELNEFLSTLLGSIQSGKISRDRKCLFCGTKLSNDGLQKIQVRMGRLRFLVRNTDEGNETAEKLLHNIIHVAEYRGGKDIPEDDPDWWNEAALKIYEEEASQKHVAQPRLRLEDLQDFGADSARLIPLLILKNLMEVSREFEEAEAEYKADLLVSLTIAYMAVKDIVTSDKWRAKIPPRMHSDFKRAIVEAQSLMHEFGREATARANKVLD